MSKSRNMDPIRQGDVVLIPTDIPKETHVVHREARFGKGQGIIVASGEATGHHHRVRDRSARLHTKDGVSYLRVGKNGASLTHEEHDPLKLEAGDYRIGTQREYEPPKPEVRQAPARPASRRVWD